MTRPNKYSIDKNVTKQAAIVVAEIIGRQWFYSYKSHSKMLQNSHITGISQYVPQNYQNN